MTTQEIEGEILLSTETLHVDVSCRQGQPKCICSLRGFSSEQGWSRQLIRQAISCLQIASRP